MRIAVTGATGFIGRYIVNQLASAGRTCRCWRRAESDVGGFTAGGDSLEWIEGALGDERQSAALVAGCDAVVHSALHHPGGGWRGDAGSLSDFVRTNVLGALTLFEAARSAGVRRFIFLSTCAVHDRILDDRPLDESHPLWPASHYGAHKAAIEKFVHSFGHGEGYDICALRPTGVYGVARPVERSKWFDLVQSVKRGEQVTCARGGKEVHAADVAGAVALLLDAPADRIRGEAFNCYDRYVSELEVATIARELCGSAAEIIGEPKQPKHQIETVKLRSLGMTFGGLELLRNTIGELLE